VYSTRGSYGGTSLLRALAALPGVLLLPGDGRQRLQPVALADVADVVVAALSRPVGGRTFEIVGPDVVSLADYLCAWRRWLGFGRAREIRVPATCVRFAAMLAERFGRGPFGLAIARMLERGNVAGPDAWARVRAELGVAAAPLDRTLAQTPAEAEDRLHARAYFWLPALRVSLALLWIVSGTLGLLLPPATVEITTGGALSPAVALALARFGGVADLVLGALCLVRWKPRIVLGAMAAMLAIYTLAIGSLWPRHWLDPFGGLVKNVPLLAALGLLLAVEERR
jgi:uncharacterized membrane protein YphA (DoxX/SURF4 family)